MFVVVGGDRKFEPIVRLVVDQCKRFGYTPLVYDLGGLGFGTPLPISSDLFHKEGIYGREGNYSSRARHKPAMIADALNRIPAEARLMYLDADAVPLCPVNELDGDYDLGVTIRDDRDLRRVLRRKERIRKQLGYANAGVVLLRKNKPTKRFVRRWALKTESIGFDQQAFNHCFNEGQQSLKAGDEFELDDGGTHVKCFDGDVYNWGYFPAQPPNHVRILHCKGYRWRNAIDEIRTLARNKEMNDRQGEPLLRKHLAAFKTSGCLNIPYYAHGISNIEAFYWWAMVAEYKPDVVLESGVCQGRSTDVLANAVKTFRVPYHIAIDQYDDTFCAIRNRLGDSAPEFYCGDSQEVVGRLTPKLKDLRVLVFVDGPKGGIAADALYGRFKPLNVVGVAVHDCSPSQGACKRSLSARGRHLVNRGNGRAAKR